MPCTGALPPLLSTLVAVVILGLLIWGLFRTKARMTQTALLGPRDDLLLGPSVLTGFTSGVFSTLVLVGLVQLT